MGAAVSARDLPYDGNAVVRDHGSQRSEGPMIRIVVAAMAEAICRGAVRPGAIVFPRFVAGLAK